MAKPIFEKIPPPASVLDDAVAESAAEGSLSCKAAFALANGNNVSPDRIGRAVDRLGIRLHLCELGLFGYGSNKKAIALPEVIPSALAEAIASAVCSNGWLACAAAWRIADRFDWPKPAVAGACDRLSVKIKPCQLGAF